MFIAEIQFVRMIDDLKLISLVEKHVILYDISRADFKYKERQEDVWISIAAILEENVQEVKKRWRIIRQRYSEEKAWVVPSGSGAGESTEWELFVYLGFLEKVVRPRKTVTNIRTSLPGASSSSSPQTSRGESHASSWDSMGIISPQEDVEVISWGQLGEFEEEASTEEDPHEIKPPSTVVQIHEETLQPKPKKRKVPKEKVCDPLMDTLGEIGTTLGAFKKTFSFQHSANWMASLLEEMPLEEAKAKQKKLVEIMLE